MLYFQVIVHPQRVEVKEVEHLKKHDHKAIVDGCEYLYKIEKSKLNKPQDKGWWGRALNTIHYHANNSGNKADFVPVSRSQYVARRKRHANQLKLF